MQLLNLQEKKVQQNEIKECNMKINIFLTTLLAGSMMSIHAHACKYEVLATTAFENIPLLVPLQQTTEELEAGHLALGAIESAFMKFIAQNSINSNKLAAKEQETLKQLLFFFDKTSTYLKFLGKLVRHYESIAATLHPFVPELQTHLKKQLEEQLKSPSIEKSVKENLQKIHAILNKTVFLTASKSGLELQADGQTLVLNLGKSIDDKQMKNFTQTAKIIIPLINSLFDPLADKEISQEILLLLFYLRTAAALRLSSLQDIGHFFTKEADGKPQGLFTLYELDKKYAKTLLPLIVEEFQDLLKHADTTDSVVEKIKDLVSEFKAKKTLLSSEIINELKLHGADVSTIEEAPHCIPGHDYTSHKDNCPCKKAMKAAIV